MEKLLLIGIICLLGCQGESKYEEQQLLGSWKAIAWNDLTNNKSIDIAVDFKFEEGNTYIGNYGDSSEKGKYWIAGENLHTIEEGKVEKKVKIKKLANDTLVFGMNRAGTLEEIILIKE